MRQPAGHHQAELNVGRLPAPTDDPRVADFMSALDRVNRLGKRVPGFGWKTVHRPTLDEDIAHLAAMQAQRDGDEAFGWAFAKQAHLWKTNAGGQGMA